MSDYLVKSLVYDGAIRAYAVDATETVGSTKITRYLECCFSCFW